jgi:hypothetical protein
MDTKDNSFDAFFSAVRDSCENHAKRKNYTTNDINGPNQLFTIMQTLGINKAHSVGEIIYKCAEYLKTPRRVLMEKVAGWAWIVWRDTQD